MEPMSQIHETVTQEHEGLSIRRYFTTPEEHPFDAYFGLKEALEELFGRPVDLVEAGAVRNPYLKASIEQSRENLYAE